MKIIKTLIDKVSNKKSKTKPTAKKDPLVKRSTSKKANKRVLTAEGWLRRKNKR